MVYLGGQTVGGLFGAFFSRFVFGCGNGPYTHVLNFQLIMRDAIGEGMGGFLFVFFIFYITSDFTTFFE